MRCVVCDGDIDRQYSGESFFHTSGFRNGENALLLLKLLSKCCVGCVCFSGFSVERSVEENTKHMVRYLIRSLKLKKRKTIEDGASSLQRRCLMHFCATVVGGTHEFVAYYRYDYREFHHKTKKYGFNIFHTPTAITRQLSKKFGLKGIICAGHGLEHHSRARVVLEQHEQLLMHERSPKYERGAWEGPMLWQANLIKRDWSRMPIKHRLEWFKYFKSKRR